MILFLNKNVSKKMNNNYLSFTKPIIQFHHESVSGWHTEHTVNVISPTGDISIVGI
jgi:hypothetical protein